MAPRARLKKSLDEILATPYDKNKVIVTVESKVFGIGFESYTVGSHEFYMNYAAKNGILCLLDNGHFHPTEQVADKISSMLLFADKVALHVSRPVRWDSDHVVLLNDDTKEIAKEIVNCGPEKVVLALDFFDASINRISEMCIRDRIHKVVEIAVGIGIFHFLALNVGGGKFGGGVEAGFDHCTGNNILILGADECGALSGFYMLKLDDLVNTAVHFKSNAVDVYKRQI